LQLLPKQIYFKCIQPGKRISQAGRILSLSNFMPHPHEFLFQQRKNPEINFKIIPILIFYPVATKADVQNTLNGAFFRVKDYCIPPLKPEYVTAYSNSIFLR
jgi:hypothetical protein